MGIYVNWQGLQQAAASVGDVKKKFAEAMASLRETVEKTTENDWQGSDANLFVSETLTKVNKLDEEYGQFLEELMKCIQENHDKFQDVVQHNINMQG